MTAEEGTVELDTLGLTKGVNYAFNVFHAERKCCGSVFRVDTTIDLQCLWTDHCGVCYGDGQSCCKCNDNNACTTDSSAVNGTCIFAPNICPDDGK